MSPLTQGVLPPTCDQSCICQLFQWKGCHFLGKPGNVDKSGNSETVREKAKVTGFLLLVSWLLLSQLFYLL